MLSITKRARHILCFQQVIVADATPICCIAPEQVKRSTRRLPSHKPVSHFFSVISIPTPIICQPLLADEDEISGPSTEDSSLLSDPGDIIDDDDATSKKSAHSHSVDVTGLALLPRPDFWQLFLLMGLLSGVGLMTIK
jgi:hypothetical protein